MDMDKIMEVLEDTSVLSLLTSDSPVSQALALLKLSKKLGYKDVQAFVNDLQPVLDILQTVGLHTSVIGGLGDLISQNIKGRLSK